MTTTRTNTGIGPPAPWAGSPEGQDDRAGHPPRPVSRWSWLWLLAGALLLPVTNLQTLVPVAAWLAPVFLLRFSRTQRAVVALPVLVVVFCVTTLVALRGGFFPVAAGAGYVLFVAGLGIGGTVPYAVDVLLARRLGGVARTLVFPLAVTVAELVSTLGNPFGTAGSTAYSQYSNLPLLQLVSVTGIWGLTFLVSWLAPVVNEVWERGTRDRSTRLAGGLLVAALLGALLFGGSRLAFQAPTAPTVRVAALAPDRALSDLAYSAPTLRPGTPGERARVRDDHLTPVLDDLFSRSAREAEAGAKIIAWSEAAARVLEEDESAVVADAARLAEEQGVYLQISMMVLLAGDDATAVNENHAVLLDPRGEVVWDYLKSKPVPGDGHEAGPGVVPTVDTPYGRLATVICQDDFFPALVRQTARAGVDILLVPTSDWQSEAAWHAQLTPFRAVENGVSVVRPARQGTSLATDAQGRLLGHKADYFTGHDQTLVTSVPTRGTTTLFAWTGDVVAYISVVVLAVLVVTAFRRRRG